MTKAQRLEQYAEECARHFMASGKPHTCRAAALDVIEPLAVFYTQDDNISHRTVINRAIAKIDARMDW